MRSPVQRTMPSKQTANENREVMSTAVAKLQAAQQQAMADMPPGAGFPYLAEVLRQAGVRTNTWWLPAMQSLYQTDLGPVLVPGTPLIDTMTEVPQFDRHALIEALRADQAGHTTFPEFASAAWNSGVLSYVVDLEKRTCTYFGSNGEQYIESYPAVSLTLGR